MRALAAEGLDVIGPVSADTAFTPESLARCDVVVAMYHDQGLPVLKALSFGEIVNVTLGLADRAHVGRSRHGVGAGRHRPRAARQPVRGRRSRAATRLDTRAAPRSGSASIFFTTLPSSAGSSPRFDRNRATRWSRSAAARARSPFRSARSSSGCTSSRSIASLRPRCRAASRIPSGSSFTKPMR